MAGGGGITRQNVQRLFDLAEARALDDVAEEDLVAIVVPGRIELEQALADQLALQLRAKPGIVRFLIDPDAGQDPRQLLHVLLRIAGAHAQGVQLHDLAGVVLVDVVGRIVRIVEVAEHGRVLQRRLEQVAETAKGVGPDRPVHIVADHRPDVGLVLMDVEMVEPEPGHLLLELIRRIEVAQNLAGRGLFGARRHRLLIGLLRRLLLIRIGQGVGRLVLGVQVHHQLGHRLAGDRQGVDLRLHRRRQGIVEARMQLVGQPAVGAHGLDLGGAGRGRAPGHAVEQGQSLGLVGGGACGRRRQRHGADHQTQTCPQLKRATHRSSLTGHPNR